MANPETEFDRLEEAVARIIEARGGDMRKALKSLIIANEHLEAELKAACANVSTGFMRGAVGRHISHRQDR